MMIARWSIDAKFGCKQDAIDLKIPTCSKIAPALAVTWTDKCGIIFSLAV